MKKLSETGYLNEITYKMGNPFTPTYHETKDQYRKIGHNFICEGV